MNEIVITTNSRSAAYEHAETLLGNGMCPSEARATLYREGINHAMAHSVMADLRERHPAVLKRRLDVSMLIGLVILALAAVAAPALASHGAGVSLAGMVVTGIVVTLRGFFAPKQYRKIPDPGWDDTRWHEPVITRVRAAEQTLCPACKQVVYLSDEQSIARAYNCPACRRKVQLPA